ncbi:replication initiator protein A [Oscillibacter sp.]|uniref:replication initiator protein A n=1 Tax=Oscillibacter sp. TaxID=1945593 RepID=UPI0026379C14|nr:replication initiator protein A [Oscillibacter sp.]MDD3347563.1 replication initiator protein A [Oscillibacter sp.]
MNENMTYDYFYGGESEQFSFYRIPRLLVTGDQFKHLSTDAKLLYGLLLDRMSLSAKNGWYDEQGRVFIYYPLEEIHNALNCSSGKAVRLFAELDTCKGIGLIERIRQGQGKPSKIYVKQFATKAVPPAPPSQDTDTPGFPESDSLDFSKQEVLTFQNETSRLSIMESPDFPKCVFVK